MRVPRELRGNGFHLGKLISSMPFSCLCSQSAEMSHSPTSILWNCQDSGCILTQLLLHIKKDIKAIRDCPKEVMRMVKGLEGKPYEEQLRSPGLLSPEKRRPRAHLTAVPQLPHEGK